MTDIITSPHVQKLRDHERDKKLGRATGEAHRIPCPYCAIGAAIVIVHRPPGAKAQFRTDPVKCESCSRYFAIKPDIKIVGVPLAEDPTRATRER